MTASAHAATLSVQRIRNGTLNYQRACSLLVLTHDDAGDNVMLDGSIKTDVIGIENHMHVGLHQTNNCNSIGMDLDGWDRFLKVHIRNAVVEHGASPVFCSTALHQRYLNKEQFTANREEDQSHGPLRSLTKIGSSQSVSAA